MTNQEFNPAPDLVSNAAETFEELRRQLLQASEDPNGQDDFYNLLSIAEAASAAHQAMFAPEEGAEDLSSLIIPGTQRAEELKDRLRSHALLSAINFVEPVTELHRHLSGAGTPENTYQNLVLRGHTGIGKSLHEMKGIMRRDPELISSLEEYLDVVFRQIEGGQAGPDSIRAALAHAFIHTENFAGAMTGVPTPYDAQIFPVQQMEIRGWFGGRVGAQGDPQEGEERGKDYRFRSVVLTADDAAVQYELARKSTAKVGIVSCFHKHEASYEENFAIARKLRHLADEKFMRRVVGIDWAGREDANGYNTREGIDRMNRIFDEAGPFYRRTIHLGETRHVDLDVFKYGIQKIRPERVGHPLTPVLAYWESGDSSGLELMRELQIVAELCVYSNHRTRAYPKELTGKVFRTFEKFGIPYTLSTDSGTLHGKTLADEFGYLLAKGHLSEEQLLRSLWVANRAFFLQPRHMREMIFEAIQPDSSIEV